MSRPIYESEQDREEERQIIHAFLEHLQTKNDGAVYEVIKLDRRHNLDYAIQKFSNNGTAAEFAFVEAKRRHHQAGDFPDLMISKSKFWKGCRLSDLGFNFFILIQFDNGDHFYHHRPQHESEVEFKESGRTKQTRDEWDAEVCAHIPIQLFTPYGK